MTGSGPAKALFEIYREPGAGAYRVVYFTELDERERDEEIERAMRGEHVFDGFVPAGAEGAKQAIDALVRRLNDDGPLDERAIQAALADVLA